jgi:hypothetical protein
MVPTAFKNQRTPLDAVGVTFDRAGRVLDVEHLEAAF